MPINRKRLMQRIITSVSVLAVVAVLLTGCGSTTAGTAAPRGAAVAQEGTPSPSVTPTRSTEVLGVLSNGIMDDQLEHQVQADKIVRAFPWTDAQSSLADSGFKEQILVHVNVSSGSKYQTTLGCGSLKIVAEGRTEARASQNTTLVVKDAMAAAGYPMLADLNQGQTGAGWCSYAVTDAGDVLDLVYMRSAATTNDGTTITKKDFTSTVTPVGE